MYMQNLKSVAFPVPEIIGGTQKIGQSLDTPTLPFLIVQLILVNCRSNSLNVQMCYISSL